MAQTFTWEGHRVRFQDVDHAGIVFFAKYYEYCHEALEEFLEQEIGLALKDFFSGEGLGAPLVATQSTHHHPLFHGDRLRIEIQVAHLGRSSMRIAYALHRQGGPLCATAQTTHAFVAPDGAGGIRSTPIPDHLRAGLSRFLREGDQTTPQGST